MQWSPQQDAALVAFRRWYKNRGDEQVFEIFGYAGSGKTSLALELAQGISGTVLFAAYTGKAASVMRKRGCAGATTLHSLLYNVRAASKKYIVELEDEIACTAPEDLEALERLQEALNEARLAARRPAWDLNPLSPIRDCSLLVVDEVSMVPEDMGRDLLSFGKPILVLGDPAQLPPVKGTGFFSTPDPKVMLTEVHRQALDNPVLAMATIVRNRDYLDFGAYGESCVIARSGLRGGETMHYDQVLVGRNTTRQSANATMRRRLGYGGAYPVQGEKLVCLKNNREEGLLNGTLWTVQDCIGEPDGVTLTVTPEEGGNPLETLAYSEPFFYQDAPRWGSGGLNEFTYGYALTTHKAQGSEWPSVYIVDESHIARAEAHRWLYTALTRASERVLLVR